MGKDLVLKETFNADFEWYKMIKISILKAEEIIGYIGMFLINKKDIENTMSWEFEEELIDYIEEDLMIPRKTCRFIYENLTNDNCIFIDEFMVYKDYRNKDYGSIAFNKLIDSFKGRILLQATPLLLEIDTSNYLNGNSDEVKTLTKRLVNFYSKFEFNIKKYPYMIRN